MSKCEGYAHHKPHDWVFIGTVKGGSLSGVHKVYECRNCDAWTSKELDPLDDKVEFEAGEVVKPPKSL